jgi:hypothetical protein
MAKDKDENAEDKPKAGRPEIFTQDLADSICEKLIEGKSLRSICLDSNMPNRSTVYQWVMKNPIFSDQYAHARELQAETLFDECIDIADDGSNDYIKVENKNGDEREVLNHEHISRSKLRVDTRQIMIKRLAPKKYGERQAIDLNVTGYELIPPKKPNED